MSRKSFRQAINVESISFDLEGAVTGMQNFECRSSMAAVTLMGFMEEVSGGTEVDATNSSPDEIAKSMSKVSGMLPAIRKFLASALVPTAHDRFWRMFDNPDEQIDLGIVMEIIEWLTETYSGERPTQQNSSSTSEGTSSGGGSTGSASSTDTPTYFRSEQTPSSI